MQSQIPLKRAFSLPLLTLAQITSLITLTVFSLINLSLWRIKRRAPNPAGMLLFARWLPVAGFLSAVAFILFQRWRWVSGS